MTTSTQTLWTTLQEAWVDHASLQICAAQAHYCPFKIDDEPVKLTHISASVDSRKHHLRVEFVVRSTHDHSAAERFERLRAHRSQIETAFADEPDTFWEWNEINTDGKRNVQLILVDTDVLDHDDWNRQAEWLTRNVIRFRNVFMPILSPELSTQRLLGDRKEHG